MACSPDGAIWNKVVKTGQRPVLLNPQARNAAKVLTMGTQAMGRVVDRTGATFVLVRY